MSGYIKYLKETVTENVDENILNYIKEYKSLTDEIERLKEQHLPLDKKDPNRKKLGYKIDKLSRKAGEIKSKLKDNDQTDYDKINSSFRGISKKCLPHRIYRHILDAAYIQLENPSFDHKVLNLLNESDSELLEQAKSLKIENELLSKKVFNVRKTISELMPNFLGELSISEYDKRIEIQKMLSKINREL